MNEYSFLADMLNKFSQLTPWVQAIIGAGICGLFLGIAYFIKETVAVIVSPPHKHARLQSADDGDSHRDV